MPQSPLGPYQIRGLQHRQGIGEQNPRRRGGPALWLYGRSGAGGRGLRLHDPPAGGAVGPRLARTRCRLLAAETGLSTATSLSVSAARKPQTGLDLRLDSRGELCATGRAWLPAAPVAAPNAFAAAPTPPTTPANRRRPRGDAHRWARGFAIHPFRVDAAERDNITVTCAKTCHSMATRGLVHGHDPAHRQLGIAPPCRPGAVDACRQPGQALSPQHSSATSCRRAPSSRQLRAQGPPLCRARRCW